MQTRLTRRLANNVRHRLAESGLDKVPDPRRRKSTKWRLLTLLQACVAAMLSGAKSLADMEALTAELSPAIRKLLGIPRRVPDTTAREALVQLDPQSLRRCLHRQIRAAHRRKALAPQDLPFGVLSMDGKVTAVEGRDLRHAQPKTVAEGQKPCNLVRTFTATLTSSRPKVCVDAVPIPITSNEVGSYIDALAEIHAAYASLDLFRLVSYDAGGCSKNNARATRDLELNYVFRFKEGDQQKLFAEAQAKLGSLRPDQANACQDDTRNGSRVRRYVYVAEGVEQWPEWTGARMLIRLQWMRLDKEGNPVQTEERYYVTSLAAGVLTGEQWIGVLRGHWAIENNCHNTWDAVFEEDDRPWIVKAPRGTLVLMMLRRIAYNVLALMRAVSMRPTNGPLHPWRTLMRWFGTVCVAATHEQLHALRTPRPPPTSA